MEVVVFALSFCCTYVAEVETVRHTLQEQTPMQTAKAIRPAQMPVRPLRCRTVTLKDRRKHLKDRFAKRKRLTIKSLHFFIIVEIYGYYVVDRHIVAGFELYNLDADVLMPFLFVEQPFDECFVLVFAVKQNTSA